MKLEDRHVQKIDPLLQDALGQAEDEEILRAVMVLGPESGDTEKGWRGEAPEPSQFRSRKAYRQALIEQRQSQLVEDIGQTLEALRDLSLTPRGGKTSRVVVVEGPAHQILTALDLPGVQHASLDRPVELVEPRRRKRGKFEDELP
jgi:hypothetical protein